MTRKVRELTGKTSLDCTNYVILLLLLLMNQKKIRKEDSSSFVESGKNILIKNIL